MVLKTMIRSLRFHLKIMKTFPKEEGRTATQDLVESITKTSGNMFVAWHPDKDFPYEYSKPIELKDRTTSSLIKENAVNNAMAAFKSKNPDIARQELMKVTYTTKHIWYPRSRDKRAKKTPMDRPYL